MSDTLQCLIGAVCVVVLSASTLSCVAEPGDTAEVIYVESSDDCTVVDAGFSDPSSDIPAMTACPDAGK